MITRSWASAVQRVCQDSTLSPMPPPRRVPAAVAAAMATGTLRCADRVAATQVHAWLAYRTRAQYTRRLSLLQLCVEESDGRASSANVEGAQERMGARAFTHAV